MKKPSRIKVISYHDPSCSAELDCFLIQHTEIPDILSSIEIVGTKEAKLALLGFSRGFVRYDLLANADSNAQKSGLGTIFDTGWTHYGYQRQAEIQHFATIRVARHIEETASSEISEDKDTLSFVFNKSIDDWPDDNLVIISYDGSIRQKKIRNGIGSLFTCKEFRAQALMHYYFRSEGSNLVRIGLPSITVTRRAVNADLERASASTRLALSFAFETKLAPLQRIYQTDHMIRVSSYPVSKIETISRRYPSHQYWGSEWKRLVAHLIAWIYKSEVNLENLEHAFSRYAAAVHDLPITEGFSAGCEAIEALFSELQQRSENKRSSKIINDVKNLIKNADLDEDSKAIGVSRANSLFSKSNWHYIREYIQESCIDDYNISILIGRCNFFRYRNYASHGRQVIVDWEVLYQFEMMKMCFQILVMRCTGFKGHVPIAHDLISFKERNDTSQPPSIAIWE